MLHIVLLGGFSVAYWSIGKVSHVLVNSCKIEQLLVVTIIKLQYGLII